MLEAAIVLQLALHKFAEAGVITGLLLQCRDRVLSGRKSSGNTGNP
jgi:hypothetical protein